MKKISLILFTLCVAKISLSQNSFGEITYSHSLPVDRLTCGKTAITTAGPGFLLAGVIENSMNGSMSFAIDRTDAGGAFTGSGVDFQMEYQLQVGLTTCGSPLTPVTTNKGVSIIETFNGTDRYAIVGAYREGCFFSMLDVAGIPTSSYAFLFPTYPPTLASVSQPLIVESTNNPGTYMITGSYGNNSGTVMYAMRISAAGVQAWTLNYGIQAEPKAIMISPYTNNLIVVGHCTQNPGDVDGFFMEIAESNGALVNFYQYDSNNTDQGFSSVGEAVSPNGFIVGGYHRNSAGSPENALMLTTNSTGSAAVWTASIIPSFDNSAGEVVGVVERYSPGFNSYRYYGVMSGSPGIIIAMLDNTGASLDEFMYNGAGSTQPAATSLSYLDLGTGVDEGLQIFGTNDQSNPTAYYLAQAYFTGETGCSSNSNLSFVDNLISFIITNPGMGTSQGLTVCNAISVSANPAGSSSNLCGPVSSLPPPASNLRTFTTDFADRTQEAEIQVFPNPVKEKFVLVVSANTSTEANISMSDMLGREVLNKNVTLSNTESQSVEVTLPDNLPAGAYNLKLIINGSAITKRIICLPR